MRKLRSPPKMRQEIKPDWITFAMFAVGMILLWAGYLIVLVAVLLRWNTGG